MKKSGKFRIGLTARICIVIIVISLSVTALVSVLNYYKYLDAVYAVHTDYAKKFCKTIEESLTLEQWWALSDAVDDYQADILSDEEMEAFAQKPEYQTAVDRIQALIGSMELEGVSVFTVDEEEMNSFTEEGFDPEDSAILYFLMDYYKEENMDMAVDPGMAAYWWDTYEDFDTYRSIFQEVIDTKKDYQTIETVEGGSVYLSDYYPILDGDKVLALILLSGNAIEITDFMNSFFIETLFTGLLAALGMILLAVAYFYFRMVRPLGVIRKEAEGFVQNNTEISDKLDKIHTHDEIEDLSLSFLQMEKELKDYIQKVAQVTEENARISTELNVATKIQVDMLPTVFPPFPERDDFKIYASMNPAKEVGGDFYDFFFVDENHLALVIADVAGKGVPAALFMSIAKSLIKNRAQMGGTPAEILYDVNNQLCDGNDEGMFVTLWMAIVDLSTGEGIAANAGHEHPVRRDSGSKYELVCYRHSLALATMDEVPFKQHTFTLKPGDRIFVYTDGLPEAINTEKVAYGTDRFVAILNEHDDASPEELLNLIFEDVMTFKGDEPQFDDLTMLMFEYSGSRGDVASVNRSVPWSR